MGLVIILIQSALGKRETSKKMSIENSKAGILYNVTSLPNSVTNNTFQQIPTAETTELSTTLDTTTKQETIHVQTTGVIVSEITPTSERLSTIVKNTIDANTLAELVLVVSSKYDEPPYANLISHGDYTSELNWSNDEDVSAVGFCSLTFQGKFYIFG